LEINPETNKTIYFTQKDKEIYIICFDWPKGDIVLKGVDPDNKVKALLLGTDRPVSVKKVRGNLLITPPVLTPDDNQLAYVFKVSGLIK
jgi:alpha-L-fucosidase